MGYILITRPEEDAQDFAEDVRAAGFTPLVAPVLNIEARDFDVPNLNDYQTLIFTSANAVRVFCARSGERSIPVYTVGTRTAKMAEKAGFKVVHSAGGAGTDLVDFVGAHISDKTAKLLHVRGAHVAVNIDELLINQGFDVETLIVYEARSIAEFSDKILTTLRSGQVEAVTFFSKRTAEQFITLVQRHDLKEALAGIKSLCISAPVLEYVQAVFWQETYKSAQPNRESLLKLLRDICTNPQGEFMQGDDNEEEKSMSAAKKKSAAIDNAAEVIERFGGIRPMAKKIDVAVTTIQGWKKRDTIPAGRRDQILEAAEEYKVDLSDVLKGAPVVSGDGHANENASSTTSTTTSSALEAPEASKKEAEPVLLSEKAATSVPPTSSSAAAPKSELKAAPRSPLDEKLAQTEKKAVRKSTWINFLLLLLGLVAVAALLLTGGSNESTQRLGALEQDVDQLRGDVDSVKAEQSFLSTLVPKDLDARIQRIQDQAVEAQQKVNQAIATAGAVSNDILGEDAGTLEERIEKVQAYSSIFTGSPQIQTVLAKFQSMSESTLGQSQLDDAVSELSAALSGGGDNLDAALETARESTPSVGEALSDVPAQELKAAALLLGMTQLRSALNRDNEAFADDLQLMKNMLGAEETADGTAGNAALMDALDKLAPRAQEGVLTPAGLTTEFRTIAGETVVASLKGEDVSFQDKIKARFGDLLQIEKEGELVNGTPTQAAMSKAEKLLEEGDVAGAIMEVESLEGPAAEVAAPWLEEAKATVLAQSLRQFIDGGVSSVSAGGGILPSGSKLIRNKETGINILVPETKKPLFGTNAP